MYGAVMDGIVNEVGFCNCLTSFVKNPEGRKISQRLTQMHERKQNYKLMNAFNATSVQ